MTDLAMLEAALSDCESECAAIDAELRALQAEGRPDTEAGRKQHGERFVQLMKRQSAAAARLISTQEALKMANWNGHRH